MFRFRMTWRIDEGGRRDDQADGLEVAEPGLMVAEGAFVGVAGHGDVLAGHRPEVSEPDRLDALGC